LETPASNRLLEWDQLRGYVYLPIRVLGRRAELQIRD